MEALLVDSSGELSDQDWSHPLEAQLLMNTQEFDLHHPLLPAEHVLSICRKIATVLLESDVNANITHQISHKPTSLHIFMSYSRLVYEDICGNGSNEADQLVTGVYSHTTVPQGQPVRRLQSP